LLAQALARREKGPTGKRRDGCPDEETQDNKRIITFLGVFGFVHVSTKLATSSSITGKGMSRTVSDKRS
jgi:hypothetical protein